MSTQRKLRSARRPRRAQRIPRTMSALEKGVPETKVQPSLYGQGLPDVIHTSLKWGARLTGATSASWGNTGISANDVRDPGLSTAATSAQGYAQLSAVYARALVLASKIKVRASHGSSSSGVGATATETCLVVFPSRGNTAANDLASSLAQPGAVKIDFDIGGSKTLTQSMDVARFLGFTKAQARADEALQSNPSTSPTLGLQWNLATQSSCAQTGLDVVIDLEVIFDVLFFSRTSVDLAFEKKLMALVVEREQLAQMRRQTPRTPQLALATRFDQGDEEKLRLLETKQPVAFTFGGSPPLHIVESDQAAQYQPPSVSAKAVTRPDGKGYVLLKAGSQK